MGRRHRSKRALDDRHTRAVQHGYLASHSRPGRKFIETDSQIAERGKHLLIGLETTRAIELDTGVHRIYTSDLLKAVDGQLPPETTSVAAKKLHKANHSKHASWLYHSVDKHGIFVKNLAGPTIPTFVASRGGSWADIPLSEDPHMATEFDSFAASCGTPSYPPVPAASRGVGRNKLCNAPLPNAPSTAASCGSPPSPPVPAASCGDALDTKLQSLENHLIALEQNIANVAPPAGFAERFIALEAWTNSLCNKYEAIEERITKEYVALGDRINLLTLVEQEHFDSSQARSEHLFEQFSRTDDDLEHHGNQIKTLFVNSNHCIRSSSDLDDLVSACDKKLVDRTSNLDKQFKYLCTHAEKHEVKLHELVDSFQETIHGVFKDYAKYIDNSFEKILCEFHYEIQEGFNQHDVHQNEKVDKALNQFEAKSNASLRYIWIQSGIISPSSSGVSSQ